MSSSKDIIEPDSAGPQLLSGMIVDALGAQLRAGSLPPGLVLLESNIADLFGVSRAPVRAALLRLESSGLLERFDGRGYLVRGEGAASPLRRDLEAAGVTVPDAVRRAVASRSSWERIYAAVEREVAQALPFGAYRLVETALADAFGVSRSVTGDVLGRLHERGLVDKNHRSQWIAGPLTAEKITEFFEIRRLLEPAALRHSAPGLAPEMLEAMRDDLVAAERDYPQIAPERLQALERALHEDCVLSGATPRLAMMIRQTQLPLITTNYILQQQVVAPDSFLTEHRTIVELLLLGAVDAAGAALDAHLRIATGKTIARLRKFAGTAHPAPPAYLVPLGE